MRIHRWTNSRFELFYLTRANRFKWLIGNFIPSVSLPQFIQIRGTIYLYTKPLNCCDGSLPQVTFNRVDNSATNAFTICVSFPAISISST
mmetsp:Transcript_3558/g.6718  ORF Transcript_3558/g.6718 Transcript_3558/m.6718 type:complete len:90 (+) Transcript_3558:138-407(+)